ncbi:hypothetical protein [Nocardia flavorosea]|uniref:hypothetical protein n=1 Tax=Nocardia flavorosea TaxID=53429 RepID=UPI002454D3E5|nr:hypothetical protein [Nocardia flavorosea]
MATASLMESESPGVHGPTRARGHDGSAVRPYLPVAGGDSAEPCIARDEVAEYHGCDCGNEQFPVAATDNRKFSRTARAGSTGGRTKEDDRTMADQTEDPGSKPSAGPAPTADPPGNKPGGRRGAERPGTVSIQVSSLVRGALIAVLAVVAIVFAVLYFTARADLAERDERAADDRRAEQLATEYAVGAATVNFQDLDAWITALKTNTTPQLAGKFDETAPKLEQILVPLQWTSTASPITAKVMSDQGGTFKVNVFVNVTSTNAQNPDGTRTTVTYTVTLDENAGWQITDVGGVDGALPMN